MYKRKGGIRVVALNYSHLRSNMKAVFDRCHDDAETILVTRKDNRNVVVMSEEAYNNLLENNYLRSSKANYDRLLESIDQLKNGNVVSMELPRE